MALGQKGLGDSFGIPGSARETGEVASLEANFLQKMTGVSIEQCQMVVLVADDLGFLRPGIPDLVTELCPPQDTA